MTLPALEVTKPTLITMWRQGAAAVRVLRAGLEPIRAAIRETDGTVQARAPCAWLLRYPAIRLQFGWCMVRAETRTWRAMQRHVKALKSEIDQGIRASSRGIADGSIGALIRR